MAGASVESCRFVVLRSSPRSFRIGSGHVQSPTPHARALPSVYIYGNSLSQTSSQGPSPPGFRSRALWRAPRTGVCGVGDHPTLDLSQRESASRSTSEKSKYFGPDGASFQDCTLGTGHWTPSRAGLDSTRAALQSQTPQFSTQSSSACSSR